MRIDVAGEPGRSYDVSSAASFADQPARRATHTSWHHYLRRRHRQEVTGTLSLFAQRARTPRLTATNELQVLQVRQIRHRGSQTGLPTLRRNVAREFALRLGISIDDRIGQRSQVHFLQPTQRFLFLNGFLELELCERGQPYLHVVG